MGVKRCPLCQHHFVPIPEQWVNSTLPLELLESMRVTSEACIKAGEMILAYAHEETPEKKELRVALLRLKSFYGERWLGWKSIV